jgi:hypothetical protein
LWCWLLSLAPRSPRFYSFHFLLDFTKVLSSFLVPSQAGSALSSDCKCDAGYAGFITSTGGTCDKCQAGTYSAVKGRLYPPYNLPSTIPETYKKGAMHAVYETLAYTVE